MDKSCFIGNFFLRFIIRFGNKIHTICTNFPCSLDQMTSATICLSLQLSTAICSMIVTILRLSIIIADSLHQISSISDSKTLIITTLSYNLPCCYCNHHILLPVVQCIILTLDFPLPLGPITRTELLSPDVAVLLNKSNSCLFNKNSFVLSDVNNLQAQTVNYFSLYLSS